MASGTLPCISIKTSIFDHCLLILLLLLLCVAVFSPGTVVGESTPDVADATMESTPDVADATMGMATTLMVMNADESDFLDDNMPNDQADESDYLGDNMPNDQGWIGPTSMEPVETGGAGGRGMEFYEKIISLTMYNMSQQFVCGGDFMLEDKDYFTMVFEVYKERVPAPEGHSHGQQMNAVFFSWTELQGFGTEDGPYYVDKDCKVTITAACKPSVGICTCLSYNKVKLVLKANMNLGGSIVRVNFDEAEEDNQLHFVLPEVKVQCNSKLQMNNLGNTNNVKTEPLILLAAIIIYSSLFM